jgi:hypothetical protein
MAHATSLQSTKGLCARLAHNTLEYSSFARLRRHAFVYFISNPSRCALTVGNDDFDFPFCFTKIFVIYQPTSLPPTFVKNRRRRVGIHSTIRLYIHFSENPIPSSQRALQP